MRLEFKVIDQTLIWINRDKNPIANSTGYLTAHFDLPPEYKGVVSAYFKITTNNAAMGVPVILNNDFTCNVPSDVIKKGMLYVSLSCSDTNLFIPTNDALVSIGMSGIPESILPTPDGTVNQYTDFQLLHAEVCNKSAEVSINSINAKESEGNAKISETNAKASEEASIASEINAKISEENAVNACLLATLKAEESAVSERNAKVSESNADSFAKLSGESAITAANKAKEAEASALTAKQNAEKINLTDATTKVNYKLGTENGSIYLEVI